MSPTARRRPGRPPGGGNAEASRTAILQAARSQFASRGVQGASLRSIAAEAGVDVSLVSRSFGSKAGLLAACMELPFDPTDTLGTVLEEPRSTFGERLIRHFFSAWDPHREVFAAIVRTVVAGSSTGESLPARQFLEGVVIPALAEHFDGDELLADAIEAQLLGLALVRYVAGIEPLASADVDALAELGGPAIQATIDQRCPPR